MTPAAPPAQPAGPGGRCPAVGGEGSQGRRAQEAHGYDGRVPPREGFRYRHGVLPGQDNHASALNGDEVA